MLKNLSQLECCVDGKVGRFLLDSDTPLPMVKEMLVQFLTYVSKIEEQVKAQQQAPVEPIAEVQEEQKVE